MMLPDLATVVAEAQSAVDHPGGNVRSGLDYVDNRRSGKRRHHVVSLPVHRVDRAVIRTLTKTTATILPDGAFKSTITL
jgi:hypothetical protein